jgi:hypothetical protein
MTIFSHLRETIALGNLGFNADEMIRMVQTKWGWRVSDALPCNTQINFPDIINYEVRRPP